MSDGKIQTRLPDKSASAFAEYADDQSWGEYRTTRELVEDGLEKNGYLGGGDTRLSQLAAEGWRFGAYSAAVVIGLHLTTPFGLAGPAVALLSAALILALLDRAEPEVSEHLTRMRRSRTALADGGESE